jgi:hypothetical protein
VLVANTGAVVVGSGLWSYVNASVLTDVQPRSGQGSTQVVVTGLRLRGHGLYVAQVMLAGETATILSETDDTVVVAAAAFAGTKTGDVVVVADTGAQVTLAGVWSYLAPGVVTAVSPLTGREGTRVTVLGSALFGHGTSLVNASLGGVPALINFANDSMVIVTAGPGPALGGLVGPR